MWGFPLLILISIFSSANAAGFKSKYYDEKLCGRLTTYKSFTLTDANNNTGNPTHLAPWAVVITLKNDGQEHGSICGGTLVTNKHVITAAHCFQKPQQKAKGEKKGIKSKYCKKTDRFSDKEIIERTTIRIGAMCQRKDADFGCIHPPQFGKDLKIKRLSVGSFFEGNCENGNDIVIIELSDVITNIEVANHACLPFDNNQYKPTTNVTSFGWGSDPGKAFDDKPFPMLQLLDLESLSTSDCNDYWGIDLPTDTFCTKEESDKNVCSGDSGGGLTYQPTNSTRNYLLAVVSYGSDCSKLLTGSTQPKAQLNTDIRKHAKFIQQFIINSK